MSEKFLLLERSMLEDLAAIDEIYASLPSAPLSQDRSQEELIVVGYRLHALYNAVENILNGIARAFENTLDDRSSWHAQLLRRMRLDLSPVRPAVLDEQTYDALDELRGFRHVFRSMYRPRLRARKMSIALEKAWEMRQPLAQQLEEFLEFVRGLQ